MKLEKIILPQDTSILSFKAPKGYKAEAGKERKLRDSLKKRVKCKIMHFRDGEGTLMLPNSYLNQRA